LSGSKSYVLFEGDVILFVDNGAIMLKTCDPHGDPVEMNDEQATTLGELLLNLVAESR
jgi:hypothetical protein